MFFTPAWGLFGSLHLFMAWFCCIRTTMGTGLVLSRGALDIVRPNVPGEMFGH